ncbi:amidohydrolase [Pendulispora albinea]|uniref:Amidohydrolase n=1 Tax=Pendulispora albinea TaxID=2741071 RepID=A0ABZ2MCJ4_9BACT
MLFGNAMLFTNATLVTMNPTRDIVTDGAIAVEGPRIVQVGKSKDLRGSYPEEQTIDLGGKLVIPGLVDTHVHLAQAMLRGSADELTLIPWLCERIWVLQGNYTEADGYASARLCIAEMLKSGTTTFLEAMLAHRYGFDGIAQAVEESGIRACLGGIVMDVGTYATQTAAMHPGMIESRESLRGVVAMHDKWHGRADGRIHVWFGPRTPGGVTPELYREMSAIARERNMGITMHLAEVEADRTFLQSEYGLSPVRYAERVGLLGPRSVLVHMIWLDDGDVALLAQTGTHVSYNPSSNAKLGSGVCDVQRLLDRGVNVALGCDGAPANNDYDLIREMKFGSLVQKAVSRNATVLPAETMLEMATLGGARALGLEREIGSLEVGKRADFAVVDLHRAHTVPAFRPVSTLVYAATGGDVDTVVVDGRIVVSGGVLRSMNEAEILAEANARAAQVYRRAGLSGAMTRSAWPVL